MQTHRKPPRPPPLTTTTTTTTTTTHSHSNSTSDDSLHSLSPPTTTTTTNNNNTAIVTLEKYYSPLTSPLPITPPKDPTTHYQHHRHVAPPPPPQPLPRQHAGVVERKEKVEDWIYNDSGGGGGGGGVVEKVNLGVRVLEFVFCLVSFSVMASDKTQGWTGDSFDRYKEYRFCLSVNVLGFLYATFQAYDAGIHLATGKHVIRHHLRYQFGFIMDQILAYLLISASSAAASRVDDWQSNWGKDDFTLKASASVSMAFMAFLGFAMTSLISGYNLFNRDSS